MHFSTEQELVETAIRHLPLRRWLKAPDGTPVFQQTEVRGLFGIPDLLAAFAPATSRRNKPQLRSIAFEMKLSDWRRGLVQAFRYRSFASTSFLVIDDSRSKPAVLNAERFKRANIGLIGLNADGRFRIYVRPQREAPFAPHLENALTEIVKSS
jgi:hypothetical protein